MYLFCVQSFSDINDQKQESYETSDLDNVIGLKIEYVGRACGDVTFGLHSSRFRATMI